GDARRENTHATAGLGFHGLWHAELRLETAALESSCDRARCRGFELRRWVFLAEHCLHDFRIARACQRLRLRIAFVLQRLEYRGPPEHFLPQGNILLPAG